MEANREKIDLVGIATEIKRSWLAITLCITGAIVGCAVYLHLTDKIYAVESLLRPLPGDAGGLPKGLGGLAGLANISLPEGAEQERFDYFFEMVYSRPIAEVVAQDDEMLASIFSAEWDSKQQDWREPVGMSYRAKKVLKFVLTGSSNDWSQPDAARLQRYIELNFDVLESRASAAKSLRVYSKYPEIDKRLMFVLISATEEQLRQTAVKRYEEYVGYLENKIGTVTVSEYRAALIDVITQQETSRMLAETSTGFAAEMLIEPTISARPVKPRAAFSLILSFLLGTVIAAGIVSYRFVFRASPAS